MRTPIVFLLLAARAAGAAWDTASSAEVCGRCHRSIHEAWKLSSHAAAAENRLFQDALEMAGADFGAEARGVCLSCHAPAAVRTGDLALNRKVSWEGVTCDYCHSVREVSLAGPNPKAEVVFSAVKTGPLDGVAPVGHQAAFSGVHISSAICAPCHEYRNAQGLPVLTTWSEWKNSRYAREGKQCQSCHMSRVAGNVVDPKIKRTTQAKVNLHSMPGSHSLDQLTKVLRADLSTVRDGARLKVIVDLTNQGAGHSFPTGSPLRQLVLEARADVYGGGRFKEERVYARRVADRNGAAIEREHFAFVKAAKVVSDTRLAAGEKRTETFEFPAPAGSPVQVKVTFWYYYSPLAKTESQQRITFLTLNRLVK